MVDLKKVSSPLEALQIQFAIIDVGGEIRIVDLIQIAGILGGKRIGDPSFYKKADATILMKRALENLPYPCKSEVVINEFWISAATVLYQGTAFTPKDGLKN